MSANLPWLMFKRNWSLTETIDNIRPGTGGPSGDIISCRDCAATKLFGELTVMKLTEKRQVMIAAEGGAAAVNCATWVNTAWSNTWLWGCSEPGQ